MDQTWRSLLRHDLLRDRSVNSLARPEQFAVIVGAFEHYIAAEKLWAHLVVLMPDHLHVLMSFPAVERMDKIIRDVKRYTAKKAGVIWQDGFFDHRLRRDESFDEKAHYIRMNPVRAGLVSAPENWPYTWPHVMSSP